MTDLDDRLTDLLTRSATAVDVHPDLDAVLARARAGGVAPVVDLGHRPGTVRRRLALAAAVLVLAGLATTAVLARPDDDRTLDQATAPASDARRFPLFGHLPPDLAGSRIEANEGEGTIHNALTDSFLDGTSTVRATLGRVADDGTISEIVQLAAGTERPESRPGPQPTDVDDLGDGYRLATGIGVLRLYGPGTIVEVVGGPEVDDLVRSIAGTALTATVGQDGAPVLTIGDLPDGYEVVAPPAATEPEQAEAFVEGDFGVPRTTVETGVGPPAVAILSAGGTVTPVTIGDGTGLLAAGPDRTRIAWTAPSGVTLSLTTDRGEDEALRIARGIELVDEATWRDAYPERADGDPMPSPDATTDHPMVGQPTPEIAGAELDGSGYRPPQQDGEWTIVSLTASWCVPCIEMLDHLEPVHDQLHDTARASVVSLVVDDNAAAARRMVADHDVGWQVLALEDDEVDAWGVDGVPATVFVDPDGVVRGVVEGEMSGREIDQTLTALGG